MVEKKKTVGAFITENEECKINDFIKQNNLSKSDFVRKAIRTFMENYTLENGNPTEEIQADSSYDKKTMEIMADLPDHIIKLESLLSKFSVGTSKMMSSSRNRIMIFLDVRNVTDFDKSIKVDFAELTDNLVKGRELMAAYAYDSVRYGTDGVDIALAFHDYIRHNGFELKLRDSTNEVTQKEVDVALAVDMLQQAYDDNYDIAILISGDRDFVPAIEKIKARGKRVEVASFNKALSHSLLKKADTSYNLDEMFLIQLMDPDTASKHERKAVV